MAALRHHLFVFCLAGAGAAHADSTPAAAFANETPDSFVVHRDAFDFVRREAMIPMRDGVKLKTIVLVPKGAKNAPILLTRTPYNASKRLSRSESPRMASVVPQMDDTAVAAGYIIAYQDVRGKHGSEGDYVLTRPLRGPLNPTDVDHATDAYDTIDWLVKNTPESNGRVGVIGGSYEGYTTMMAVVDPHPALKVAVPFAPMVDGWVGDDWFHNGAFRQEMVEFIYEQQATRKSGESWWSDTRDTYDEYLRGGSAGAMAMSRGLDQLGFWRAVAAHPAYDAFWQEQAVDKILAKLPITVPMMIVAGLFDQEDIYGGPALFKALAPKDPNGRMIHLVLGPWNHGQGRREGRGLGPILFEGDTARWFRRTVMQPFLDHYLQDGPKPDTPRVLVYETGADRWHRYDAWPRACAENCPERSRNLYLLSDGKIGFDKPTTAIKTKYDEYVSDPAKPVPYRTRPTLSSSAPDSKWGEWLVDDQRNAAARPDVLVYESEPLTEPLRLAGQPIAHLFASTSGTDADWVVKLIDVWPPEDVDHPALGGYQWMISADILRGRYRQDPANPKPLAANQVLEYRWALPHVSHTFQKGHRIMVQIQSTWFPLYDRNPQKYVPNILFAEPADYVKATHRIWRTPENASCLELPVTMAR
jgi:hypothetical protein